MKLFKKRKQMEEVDPRTKIERDFEEKGQVIGRKTGEVVQKSVNKIKQVKTKLQEDGTMDKLRRISDKVDDTIDSVVDTVAKKGKAIATKTKRKQESTVDTEDDLYYQ